jgi:hypothetical protein
MFKYTIYIILSLIYTCQLTCLSQDPPDDTTDSEYYTIMFELYLTTDTMLWNGPLPGDACTVNYDNKPVTADSFIENISEGINVIRIPKYNLIDSQTLDVSLFSLTFNSSDRGCLLNAKDISVSRMGDTIVFTQIEAFPVRIFYDEKRFCENEMLQVAPTVSDYIPDVNFSSPDGLNIDDSTGIISIGSQSAGLYSVQYASTYCLENYKDTIIIDPRPSFTIERNRNICEGTSIELSPDNDSDNTYTWSNGISERSIMVSQPGEYVLTAENEFGCRHTDTVKVRLKTIQVEQFDYEVTDADCYNAGRIDIKQLDILNGELPYKYRLENRVNNQLMHRIDNLREGDYILTIEDADGCITTVERIISIRKDCLNDYPVFSPNTDGIDDDYFIPYEGKAVVYDRNGIERARFMAPAYWDGSDNNGKPLPMGTYLIVVGNKEVINITIVK